MHKSIIAHDHIFTQAEKVNALYVTGINPRGKQAMGLQKKETEKGKKIKGENNGIRTNMENETVK